MRFEEESTQVDVCQQTPECQCYNAIKVEFTLLSISSVPISKGQKGLLAFIVCLLDPIVHC